MAPAVRPPVAPFGVVRMVRAVMPPQTPAPSLSWFAVLPLPPFEISATLPLREGDRNVIIALGLEGPP
jgi:hypothetical protein